MPNWGPPEFRRFSAEIRFAEMRHGRISLLRLLPGTLAHALVVLHNALPTGYETSHNG